MNAKTNAFQAKFPQPNATKIINSKTNTNN